jgi:hypothetical protein
MYCNLLAHRVKARDHFFVASEDRPPSADQLWEKRAARRHLCLLDLHEPLARQAESTTSSALRAAFSRRYQELIGVRPDLRDEFRAALAALDSMSVADLLARYRAR